MFVYCLFSSEVSLEISCAMESFLSYLEQNTVLVFSFFLSVVFSYGPTPYLFTLQKSLPIISPAL